MSQLTTLEILRWGREVMANPKTFAMNANYLDAKGRFISPHDARRNQACRFCSIGFLWALNQMFGIGLNALSPVSIALSRAAGYCGFDALNDGQNKVIQVNNSGQSHTIAMWDRAIKIAESEAAQ